jgi:hypothetical protein
MHFDRRDCSSLQQIHGGKMIDDYEGIMDFCDVLGISCENPFNELFYDYYDTDEEYYEDYRQ